MTAARPDPAGTEPECRGFYWIGQPFSSCDNCGRPAWEHDGMQEPDRDNPFSGDPGTVRVWEPGEADAIRAKWGRETDQ